MTRVRLILGCLLLVAAAAPAAAMAGQRIPVGFQDDPSFRWRDDRVVNLDAARTTGASIIRTTAYWSSIAPTRPVNATDPFDPAYHFEDLNELIRNAELRGMTVLLTIWGTPGWANNNAGQNHAPTKMSDLQNFAQALASRYSGRYTAQIGPLYVGYFSLWNEPNLEEFLAPAYNAKTGKPASPYVYASMARAAYAGIKAGNKRAKFAIGETSPRGRQKPISAAGTQNTIAPALFAHLVATAPGPRVRFDAWAHHPYSGLGQKPLAKVAWPNVNLSQMPRFEKSIDQWFHRKGVPIWITEYGFETKPGEPKGVTLAQQAAYARQTFSIVQNDPRIDMFIWFIFRDDPTSTWQSGLENEDNSHKLAFAAFSSGARALDWRNPFVRIKPGTSNPTVRLPLFEFLSRDGSGAPLGSTISVTYRGKSIAVKQPAGVVGADGWTSFKIPITKAQKNGLYVAYLHISDANGGHVDRVAELFAG
jgi:Cellulase (glycosyl hydrolase family 5)